MGTDDIYVDAVPANPNVVPNIDQGPNPHLNIDSNNATDVFCQNVKQFQSEVDHETKHLDNYEDTTKKLKQKGNLV